MSQLVQAKGGFTSTKWPFCLEQIVKALKLQLYQKNCGLLEHFWLFTKVPVITIKLYKYNPLILPTKQGLMV